MNTHSVQWVLATSYFFEKYPWFLYPERNPSCLARRVLIPTASLQTVRSASTPSADKGCAAVASWMSTKQRCWEGRSSQEEQPHSQNYFGRNSTLMMSHNVSSLKYYILSILWGGKKISILNLHGIENKTTGRGKTYVLYRVESVCDGHNPLGQSFYKHILGIENYLPSIVN